MNVLTEPNEAELLWLAGLLDELRREGIGLDAFAVSEYFERRQREWTATPELAGNPNTHINRVGAAVGEILVRSSGLRWKVNTDEYGTELVVHGEPGDILIFPMNAVAKRWTGESSSSIEEFLSGATTSIARIRSAS